MSHFYAAIPTSARCTMPTARGHKSTGIATYTASWRGRIRTDLWHDPKTGLDHFEVSMTPHDNDAGDSCSIASGIIGDKSSIKLGSHFDKVV